MQIPLATYWMAAAESGYAKPSDWRSWADQIILVMPHPPIWIIDMAVAEDVDGLAKALNDRRFVEGLAEGRSREASETEFEEIVVGYFWLRFRKNEIALSECLWLAAWRSDAYQLDFSWDELLELRSLLQDGSPSAPIELHVKQILGNLGELAQRQWDTIINTTIVESA